MLSTFRVMRAGSSLGRRRWKDLTEQAGDGFSRLSSEVAFVSIRYFIARHSQIVGFSQGAYPLVSTTVATCGMTFHLRSPEAVSLVGTITEDQHLAPIQAALSFSTIKQGSDRSTREKDIKQIGAWRVID